MFEIYQALKGIENLLDITDIQGWDNKKAEPLLTLPIKNAKIGYQSNTTRSRSI